MRNLRLAGLFAVLALGLGTTVPGLARESKEERARKQAFEEALDAFKEKFKSEDPVTRREAVKRLLPFADIGAVRFVAENVLGEETNPGVLNAALGVLASATTDDDVKWLVKQAVGRGDWQERVTIVEALGHIEDARCGEALKRLLAKEKDARVITMALFGVAACDMRETMPDVLRLLEHDDWQVRVAAIEALTVFKQEKAVPALIDRLMNERGRLRQDLADALKAITGKNFGRNANAWRKWFHERDGSDPEPGPAKEEGPAVSGTAEPTYFGIKVISDRVLFVLDVSMSMKTPIDIDKMKLVREAARTGDDDGPGEDKDDEKFEQTIKWWKIKDRLDLAKAQLQFVIKNLGEKQQFEIVTFSETVTPWNGGKLMKATRLAKTKASQFLETLDVEGATAAGAALDFAFEMAGPGAFDKNYRSGVDTLFFLSDGAPTDRAPEEILEQLRHRNRLRKIKIHVVAILNFSTSFLRLLAEQNGGVYKLFKVANKVADKR